LSVVLSRPCSAVSTLTNGISTAAVIVAAVVVVVVVDGVDGVVDVVVDGVDGVVDVVVDGVVLILIVVGVVSCIIGEVGGGAGFCVGTRSEN